MQRRTLVSLLIAAAFPAAAIAMPRPWIGPAGDATKQAEVQSTAVYAQEGATSGMAADKLEAKSNTPPKLATTQQKLAAVEHTAVYPQEGATSGRQAVIDRGQVSLRPPLATNWEKQQAVAAATNEHAHG